jgi:hypothetical protein
MNDVTQLLSALGQGDPHATSQLLPLVYEELRRLAAQRMAQEQPGQTLQPPARLHEAYFAACRFLLGQAGWIRNRGLRVPRYQQTILLFPLGLASVVPGQSLRRVGRLREKYAQRMTATSGKAT